MHSRLATFCAGGCASKLEYEALLNLVGAIDSVKNPDLLIGFDDFEDAAAIQITDDVAMVLTTDFMTPVVKDPFDFGQIAAAAALSDIYAKGGTPILGLVLAGIPGAGPNVGPFAETMKGAQAKLTQAGVTLAGGHSIRTDAPLFGLAVLGRIRPDRLWRKRGARPGDALVITKPLGNGALFSAIENGAVDETHKNECVRCASELNRQSAEVLSDFSVHAATDVSGFGIALHARDMGRASSASIELNPARFPILEGFDDAIARGFSTTISDSNRAQALTEIDAATAEALPILFDPQTNGGLLVALPADEAPEALHRLRSLGSTRCEIIGRVLERGEGPFLTISR